MKTVPIINSHDVDSPPIGRIKLTRWEEPMSFMLSPTYVVRNGKPELLHVSLLPMPVGDNGEIYADRITKETKEELIEKEPVNNVIETLELS